MDVDRGMYEKNQGMSPIRVSEAPYPQPEPKRHLTVPTALDELSAQIDSLRNNLDSLGSHLGPILVPNPGPGEDVNLGLALDEHDSLLRSNIFNQIEAIKGLNNQVLALRNGLDL